MLQVIGLNKYYGKYHALKNINVQFQKGEFVAILGESGSGKSTLLNVISGLDDFETGEIIIAGNSTKNFSKQDWAQYRNHYVGFVFQEYNLIDHLSIVENVELPLLLQGVSKREARKRALDVCYLLGLKNHVDKTPNQVSGGQQQRTAIARSLVTNPSVILADEPTGALDSENAKIILDILKKLSKDYIVILVTHDEEYAHQYADRIITLEDGMIIGDTKPLTSRTSSFEPLMYQRLRMKFNTMFKFAKNNIKKRKFRTLFTSLTMSIGLIAIFLIIFLITGIRSEVKDFITRAIPESQYSILAEKKNVVVDQSKLDAIRNMKEVNEAYYQYRVTPLSNNPLYEIDFTQFGGIGKGYVYQPMDYTLVGIPTHEHNSTLRSSYKGNYPKSEDQVIVTSRVAEKLLGFNINEQELLYALDQIKKTPIYVERISHTKELHEPLEITGIIFSSRLEIYALNSKLENYEQELTPIDYSIQEQGYYYYESVISVNKTEVKVYLENDRDQTVANVERKLAELGLILKNPTSTVYRSIDRFFNRALYILVGTASVSLVVSGILVGLMVYISVIERVKEVGILTALGAKRSNIRNLFIFESGFVGFLSSFIAIFFAFIISIFVNLAFNSTIGALMKLINPLNDEQYRIMIINGFSVFIIFLISVGYAIICGLIPALKASRLHAIDALRTE